MKTKKEKSLFMARILVILSFAALVIPMLTSILFALTLVLFFDQKRMQIIQNILGNFNNFNKSVIIFYAIIFFLGSVILFLIESIIISATLYRYKKMKRCHQKNLIIENF